MDGIHRMPGRESQSDALGFVGSALRTISDSLSHVFGGECGVRGESVSDATCRMSSHPNPLPRVRGRGSRRHAGFVESALRTISCGARAMVRGADPTGFVFVVMLLLLGTTLRADIPAGKDVPTQRMASERAIAFEQKFTVEAYKTIGKKDPKWDDAAILFLYPCRRPACQTSRCALRSRSWNGRGRSIYLGSPCAEALSAIILARASSRSCADTVPGTRLTTCSRS